MNRLGSSLASSVIWIGFTAFVVWSFAHAQSAVTGSLGGKVFDSTGSVLPGVEISVTHSGIGHSRNVVSDQGGRWQVAALPTGPYEVTLELDGFKSLKIQGVLVEAAVPRSLDSTLQVADLRGETITVIGNGMLATPETATAFRQITTQELLEVPMATRSFTHLLSAEAGISADLPPVLVNSNGNISPSVNGTRTTSTSLSFNGIDATNLSSNQGSLQDSISPSPETLEEVKLQTSLYDASTGRSGGGNFQLITRSGTNQFHGTAYWYLQNERFNANDFFFNKDGIDRPRARRNEGGFTIGGPILRDRTFFFAGYQRTQADTAFVPTAQSTTALPEALRLISGARTPANLVEAFRTLNPNFPLQETEIGPIAVALLNLRNPVTGDFVLPAPNMSRGTSAGFDNTVGQWAGGNPLVRQRNVEPAEFQQDQVTLKLDQQLSASNRIMGTFFFANYPGFDPFPDPSSLASPFTLRRSDRNRTLAVSNVHTFGPTLIHEARFGIFFLDNTRRLDDEFLAITNDSVGIPNPANFFDASPGTTRLGHFVFRNNLSNLSFGGPNDSFNRREQRSFSVADSLTWIRGSHTFKFGGEFKHHRYDTDLPEEQATEFEKFENFTQFLAGVVTEADTQFGITDKRFRMNDLSWYVVDDWKVTRKLTLSLGLRWDWFGWPWEVDGRIGNFDFQAMTDTEDPTPFFIVPSNVRNTGFTAIDEAILASGMVNNRHTLSSHDLNNFQPRFGLAFSPLNGNRLVLRGGYGIFYDRPSAAFMNTIFSNYPFLREIEVTFPSRAVPLDTAFSQQDPTLPFNHYLPNRVVYQPNGTYVIRDGTPVPRGADGALNPVDLSTGLPALGNVAETFEFRAVDRNLKTPYIQQWSLGVQYEIAPNLLVETRYVGTRGAKLLQALAFNQSYDLNDPSAPDHIFGRFNRAYQAAYEAEVARTGDPNALRGPLNSGTTQREIGAEVAFGFPNPVTGNPVDFNMSRPVASASETAIIPFEARGPIMGFNIPEALLLQSSSNSIYNALQLNVTKRMSSGLQFNASYTWSKSIDDNSADPGSTAGSGRPDVPNVGFVVQGDQRNLRMNRALSDFDRPHRFSLSFVYDLPTLGSSSRWVTGWQVSGFGQFQSGSPFTIFSPEPEASTPAHLTSLQRGSGGLFRLGFGRPNLVGSLDDLRRHGADPTEEFFNTSALTSPLGGFGNLGRNTLRGSSQKRFDLGLSKLTQITESTGLDFRWEIFNVLNNVNFALPGNDLSDSSDFGKILNTVGGPRVMQFALRLSF